MDDTIKAEKYSLAFLVAGIIAIAGFGSGDFAFGLAGLVLISLLAGLIATRLARY